MRFRCRKSCTAWDYQSAVVPKAIATYAVFNAKFKVLHDLHPPPQGHVDVILSPQPSIPSSKS